jgi:hypothetical protein
MRIGNLANGKPSAMSPFDLAAFHFAATGRCLNQALYPGSWFAPKPPSRALVSQ